MKWHPQFTQRTGGAIFAFLYELRLVLQIPTIETMTAIAAAAMTPYLAVTVAMRTLVGPSAPPIIDVLAPPLVTTLFITICSQMTLISIWVRTNKAKTPITIKIALHTLRRVSFLFANCSFNTSSLAAIVLRSESSSVTTGSPKRTFDRSANDVQLHAGRG